MEAVESISDGIETHLAALAEDGMPIPEASDIDSDDGRVVYVYADADGFTSKAPSMSSEAPCKNEASSKTPSEVATMKHLKNVALMACIFTGITMCVSIYLSQWVLFVLLFIVNFFALSVYDEIKKLL